MVTTEHDIAQYVPDPPEGLLGFDRSVELALQRIRDAEVVDPLVDGLPPRRPQRPPPHRPRLGRRQPLRGPAQPRGRRLADVAVAGRRGHRRRPRLVLLPAGLARARPPRPVRRRGGAAPRTPRPGAGLRRRERRLLAGRGARRGHAAAAPRRDAPAGPGLAGARRESDPTAGAARSTTSGRSSTPRASSGTPTGGRWRPSTGSSSAAWRATSAGRRGPRPVRHPRRPVAVQRYFPPTERTPSRGSAGRDRTCPGRPPGSGCGGVRLPLRERPQSRAAGRSGSSPRPGRRSAAGSPAARELVLREQPRLVHVRVVQPASSSTYRRT